jgi:hypothetical protein
MVLAGRSLRFCVFVLWPVLDVPEELVPQFSALWFCSPKTGKKEAKKKGK